MSAPFRRAAYVLSKASDKPAAVTTTAAKAVSVQEARTAQPQKTSTMESMQPWDGWFSSFLKTKMGDEKYQKFRDFWTFRPDDIHGLEQAPRPNTKLQITDDGKTHMYRYPSPGSADPVHLPRVEDKGIGADPYNVTYYPTDTRRRHLDRAMPNHSENEQMKIALMDPEDPRVIEYKKKLEEGPGSSPGNKGMFATGKSDYDPTGLRATMSTNHASVQKVLDENEPDHLPMYSWEGEEVEEWVEWHEARGLPVPVGVWKPMPKHARVAHW
eukprot:CAMPEP_0178952062 /NCGR_PEP_ID=MMETSP0789-20121207/7584_1 /TAXON_ID=3005 /ORGANISM="Rhizosolenia setigera, Strain CCMP 1694" /LENGTH=269 /DNA_ID=CAMNT_0020633027 /DNA_START=102 /DNA_END=911 /DNA_ORIENTATION=+